MAPITAKRKMKRTQYRKFLYFAIFRRTRWTLPYIIVISMIGGFFTSIYVKDMKVSYFIMNTFFLLAITLIFMIVRYEQRNIKYSRMSRREFYSITHVLNFSKNKISVGVEGANRRTEYSYDQVVQVLEGRTMLTVFFTPNFATYISKKDMGWEQYENLKEYLKQRAGEKYFKIRSFL